MMDFLIGVAIALVVVVPTAEIFRTKNDRRTMQERGIDIGAPWSGRCVSTRVVDLKTSPDASLWIAESAIVAVKGSGVVVDRNTWSVHGWTGTHIGAYGTQVSVFVTQIDPTVLRLMCYCRPRSKTTGFSLGTMDRRADRLASEIGRLSGSAA
jgi:hypothetical protein